ncbi:hypothetical protein J1605_006042 [Eschrichtius robustus]|uniref:Enoyl-CoA delta isomerase 1, mitochondrial n=1 Tax=Eschrichtius robustus TaxID=9764 RepID=A0AB34H570_ESCRO|nr:hypothetical protein J1605_006042 [Eschrichtius robustus]
MKFKNPPVNSLSLELLTEFIISLEKLENDKTFRGIILTSKDVEDFECGCPSSQTLQAGEGVRSLLQQHMVTAASAGLDLTEMCGKNPAHYAEYWKAVQELWLRLYLSNLVLIAAINMTGTSHGSTQSPVVLLPLQGACPAGGCLISLTCDYRILADNPKYLMGLNETLLGIVAPFWFKDTFVNTIGHRASEQALQLGLLFRPAEALQVGLVDQVVPEDQVLSTALSVMARWMAIPDHARQLTKNMMRKTTVDRLVKQRDTDIQNFVSFISRDSIQKSLQMYLEKLKQKKG